MATEIFKALHGSTPIYKRYFFEEKNKFYNLHSTVSLKQPKSQVCSRNTTYIQYCQSIGIYSYLLNILYFFN